MGYSLVKYLDSAEYHRALFYLDRGESDLPEVDKNTIAMGSRAISQSTGQEWFLDTNYEWKPVRNNIGNKTYERNKYGGNEFEISPKVSEVKVIPQKLTMNKNSSAQLQAETIGDDIFDKRVRWEILSSVTNDTYITQDGYIHIGNFKKATVLTVRAISLVNEKFYKDISIQVDPFGELVGEVYSILISPNQPTIGIGQSLQFVATVCGNGSYDKEVDWSISASSNSSITEDGKLIIGSNESYPVIIVTARSRFNKLISVSMPVIIKATDKAPSITNISIAPHSMTLGPNCFASLAAIVSGKGNYINDVKWSVNASSEETEITRGGILVIGSDELEGEITVRAESVIDETKFDEITVIISKSITPRNKKVLDVIVEPNTFSIYKSYSAIFSAKVVGINVYDQRVKWSVERNSSDYTKIKNTGSFVVASEEDSNSVVIKATPYDDSTVFGLAAVEILSGNDNGKEPLAISTVVDIVVDEEKNLIIKFSDGSEKIAGKISNGVFTPHINSEDKVLSFTFDAEPGETPEPVDLSVDLTPYALKSQIITDTNITVAQDVGGVRKDKYYPTGTEVRKIVKEILGPRPQPTGEILLYKGATNDPPADYTGFEKMEGYTKQKLLDEHLITTIAVTVDPVAERGQYPVLAVGNELKLVKWNQAAAPEFPTNSFERVDKGDYSLYYLTKRVTKSIEYLFTFAEV